MSGALNTLEREPRLSRTKPARCASVDDTLSGGKQARLTTRPDPQAVGLSK